MILSLLACLRPKQWTKNFLVFAGFLFTINQDHPSYVLLKVVAAFAVFCIVSSSGYLVNDILDIERDRIHPVKCKRPIASGAVSKGTAVVTAAVLGICGLWGAYTLDIGFGIITTAYIILTLAYSIKLKHIVIIDILTLTSGFVIRAVAGAIVIHVAISPWLLVCTTLLALFMGLAKRRAEVVKLKGNATNFRKTLGEYTEAMLDQMINIAASASMMAYFLYTFAPGSKTAAHHSYMMLTIPFVIYGLFRYLYLIHTKDAGGSPEQMLIDDKPMLINVILYVITAIIVMKI